MSVLIPTCTVNSRETPRHYTSSLLYKIIKREIKVQKSRRHFNNDTETEITTIIIIIKRLQHGFRSLQEYYLSEGKFQFGNLIGRIYVNLMK